MSDANPSLWKDDVSCGLCGERLIKLSYTYPHERNPMSPHVRPTLKCPKCAQKYEWRGSAGWAPPAGDPAAASVA